MSKTRQEIFDIAYRGLASQGFEKSVDGAGWYPLCRYRGYNGRRCAIGWCIPDEKYNGDIEGTAADGDQVRRAAGIRKRDIKFAKDLQGIHDDSRYPFELKKALAEFALERRLTIPEVSP